MQTITRQLSGRTHKFTTRDLTLQAADAARIKGGWFISWGSATTDSTTAEPVTAMGAALSTTARNL